KMPNDDVLKEAAESLGVLPETGMERAKGIILVEGKSDITFLRHTASTLKAANVINRDLDDQGLIPIHVGGCGNVKHWVTHRLADEIGLPWCVFLDSDLGDPFQHKTNLKRKQEVEGLGRPFYSTRKREIENYLCPDLILHEAGVAVNFTNICDAKQIIGDAVGMKPDDVSDRFWPRMSAEQILERSMYQDGDKQRSELKELIENLLALVH
ncbi:TOPRIM nucleotidyl transferase/hydrolase domain-containing protein, partial [Pseudomonas sp. FSL R10-0071]